MFLPEENMLTKKKALALLTEQINIAKSLKEKPPQNNDWESWITTTESWMTTTENRIKHIYGVGTNYLKKFSSYWIYMEVGTSDTEENKRRERKGYIKKLDNSISLLEVMIEEIKQVGHRRAKKNHVPPSSLETSYEAGVPGWFKVSRRKIEKK